MKWWAWVCLLGSTAGASGQDASARSIQEKAQAAVPRTEKLRFYELDWAKDLTQAKARAHVEKRPIVLLWVTNITAGCDFFTGHT